MNSEILKSAAIYVNAYRTSCERKGHAIDNGTLRAHVSRLFGDVYAAILIA